MAATPDRIERLLEISKGCDPGELEALLRVGKAEQGVTMIDLKEVLDYMTADAVRARAAVALAAAGTAAAGSSHNEVFRTHLGLLYAFYPERGAGGEFEDLLHECVPDVDRLVLETERSIESQLG